METKYAEIHTEWWNEQTGQEVLFRALRTLPNIDGCVVHNPDMLTEVGEDWGECDLWYTVHTAGETLRSIVDAIRSAGIRVKQAEGHNDDERARLVGHDFFQAMHDRWEAEDAERSW